MKLFLSQTHSDEEGGIAEEGKLGIIYANKEAIFRLAKFLDEVSTHLNENENCHMHFRDSFPEWDKENFIDLEINV